MRHTEGGVLVVIGLVMAACSVFSVIARAIFLRRAVRMSAIVVAHTEHQPPSMMVKLARGDTVKLIAPTLDAQPIGTELRVLVGRGKTDEAQLPGWEDTWIPAGATAALGICFVLYGWLHDWIEALSR